MRTIEISAPSFLIARTTPVDTAATADPASMAMGYSVWQRVTLRFCFKWSLIILKQDSNCSVVECHFYGFRETERNEFG